MPAVLCSKCGTDLPEGSQFCLNCGEAVAGSGNETASQLSEAVHKRERSAPRTHVIQVMGWFLLALFLLALFWAITSDSPFAQGMQDLAGWKHDQTVLDTPVSVSPHSFRYYKFALPQGSSNVSIVGRFAVSNDGRNVGQKAKDEDTGDTIEVYVLSESAFAVWQNGYATSTVYQSGRVAQGSINAELPVDGGVYYLVFSNKFAPKSAKKVTTDILLHYKSWMPVSIRHMSERLWNWLGI